MVLVCSELLLPLLVTLQAPPRPRAVLSSQILKRRDTKFPVTRHPAPPLPRSGLPFHLACPFHRLQLGAERPAPPLPRPSSSIRRSHFLLRHQARRSGCATELDLPSRICLGLFLRLVQPLGPPTPRLSRTAATSYRDTRGLAHVRLRYLERRPRIVTGKRNGGGRHDGRKHMCSSLDMSLKSVPGTTSSFASHGQ
jgi:hypothetical protein